MQNGGAPDGDDKTIPRSPQLRTVLQESDSEDAPEDLSAENAPFNEKEPTTPIDALPKGPNIRQLASVTGFSRSTVSAALLGRKGVAEETRKRILDVAAQKGYRPDPRIQRAMGYMARARKSRIPCNIAWLSFGDSKNWWHNPWTEGYWNGAKTRAEQLGFHLEEIWFGNFSKQSRSLGRMIRARGIEGVIVPEWERFPPQTGIDWEQLSVVGLGHSKQPYYTKRVAPHYAYNVQLAMEHVYRIGYKRPASWIGSYHNWESGYNYYANFNYWRSIWFPDCNIPSFSPPSGHWKDDIIPWFRQHKPDVIIGAHGELDEHLKKAGIRVPDDVGLVHLSVASDVKSWSGINLRMENVGEIAAETLTSDVLRRWNRVVLPPMITLVEGTWQHGSTTRPEPAGATSPQLPLVY